MDRAHGRRKADNEKYCEVARLITQPDYQQQGIATQLMMHLENDMHQTQNIQHFQLFTGHKSIRSINLYTKLGYKIYKQGQKADHVPLVFMQKII